ncbi:hypothetical protein MLC52_11085 [Sulfurimonas sp. NW15]|uniref:hypothetical protein n=2 Tax=Sulfurimonadaceae TaxID=2771471 RepID=UPI00125EB6C6
MKNSSDILNSLQNKPQFSKLSQYKCIHKIQSAFSPPLQKMIKFSYIKNKILFFVLNHPGAKQEFDNSIQSIKSALKFHTPAECENETITDIKAFVTHKPALHGDTTALTQPRKIVSYRERATGNFDIPVHDEKLRELILSIQKIIKEKNDT